MAASFNLTAQLNLRGPSNIRTIVSNIRRQLGTISGDINFNINPTTTRNVAQLNSALQSLNQTFAQTALSARNASSAIAAFSNAANAGNINNVATNLNNVGTAATRAAQSITTASRQTVVARTEMEEFGRQSALAIRRFAAFSVSTGAVVGLTNAIRKGISAFIEYDQELVKLQQVTGESANGLAKLSSTITSLSTGLGVASSDLIQVSSTLAQAGLSARDTERALKALALSALAPSFDNLNKTVEGSIALMRQFGISAGDLQSALGSVNAVAAAFAVESADIIAAIQRTGGVFASASKGVSEGKDALNEFIAVFTSVRQTTRESAETIATGLRTIFTRIQRGGTIEALKDFGVNLTDVEGKFVGAYRAVQLLSEGLNRIDSRDIKFSQIVEELGGFRQIGKVIPLIQQFATAQQALAVAQAGAGSLAEDAVIAQLSLANQISKVREEFLALFREIGSSDSFQTIARGALDVASALIRVADSVKGVLPVLGIMMAMRGASAITQFGAGFLGGIRRGGGAGGLGNRMAGGFASGGYVPGRGNRDTVPAMLTPGEFVIRKKAVEKIGVGRLATLNRNGGGPVQYLNSGGQVQRFSDGKFAMPKGRGSKGSKGARGPKGFEPLSSEEYSKWSRQIYSEWDANPQLPRKKYMGINMPEPIARYHSNARKYALETGGAGLALGRDAKGREVIAKFGKAQEQKAASERKLKKTDLGLFMSAAGYNRGQRAPETAKAASYARFNQAADIKPKFIAWGKGQGSFRDVIAGAEDKIKSQLSGENLVRFGKLLEAGSLDAYKAMGGKDGHIPPLKKAIYQIMGITGKNSGGFIQRFARGGRASNRLGIFDFDMTTGVTKQKETPSLSGFRNPRLAVPDILGATPTGLVELMKKYGASQILTARSGGPRGEMRTALGTFFKRNGVMLPSSSITTLGDQVGNLSTAEKKARALYTIVKKYGSVDFFDDDTANIDAAKMVRGVNAKRVAIRKNLGGIVQKFKDGKYAKKVPIEQQIESGMIDKKTYRFGLVGLQSGTGEQIRDVSPIPDFTRGKPKKEGGQGVKKYKVELHRSTFYPGIGSLDDKTAIEDNIKNSFANIVKDTSSTMASSLKSGKQANPATMNKILTGAPLASIVGTVFEAALASLGSPFINKPEKAKSIDFPLGLGSVAKDFGIPPNIPTDATRTIAGSGKSVSDMKGQIGRFLGALENQEFSKGFAAKFNKATPEMKDAIIANLRSTPEPASVIAARVNKDLAKNNITVGKTGLPLSLGEKALQTAISRGTINGLPPPIQKVLRSLYGSKIPTKQANGGSVPDIQKFAAGGMATNQNKANEQKQKNFGQIALRTGSRIQATYIKDGVSARSGQVIADKVGGNLFSVQSSAATKGYGPKLYDVVMEAATAQGGMLTSDRRTVSGAARAVWDFYFNKRSDVAKIPLDPANWTSNSRLVDPKLYGPPETWPPKNDPAWVLQTGYRKTPSIINNAQLVQKFAKGGSAEDTVPALLTPGEFVINKKAAKRIGSARLHRLNKADKINGFNKGGSVGNIQKFAVGGAVDTAVAAMSPKDAARLKASIQKNAQAFEQLERLVAGWTSLDDVGMAAKKFARSLEKGASTSNALTDAVNAGVTRVGATRTQKKGILQQTAGAPENRNVVSPVGPQGFAASQARLNAIAGNLGQYNAGANIVASRNTTSGMMGGQVNLSAASQKYAASLSQNTSLLSRLGQAAVSTQTAISNTSGAFSRFSTTLRQNPFKAIQQVTSGVATAFSKITTALSTATAAVTAFGKRAGMTTPGGGGGGGGGGDGDKPKLRDRLQNAAFGLSFAIPMIADMMTVAEPKNAQQAATNAQMTGISTAVGSATMLASMGPLGMIAAIPTAVGGIIKAFADAKNAAHEFNKQAQSSKLEESLEKAGAALDNYSKNVKDTASAEKARAAVLKANKEASTLSTMQQEPRASMVGMVADYFGAAPQDNMAMQRSQILEQKGLMSYLGSIGFGGGDAATTTSVEFRSLIPQLAKENAKTFQGAAEASTRFLENQFKSGKTVEGMAASGELKEFGRSLALADVKVQEYMMAVDNTVGLSDAQKTAMKDNIVATQAEAKAREIQTRALREKALETLNRQTTQLQNSLERMFQNMEQAINANAYSLTKLSDNAELAAASLSGAARAGTVRVDAISALNNPRGVDNQQRNAAITQAASMFGSQAPEMEGVLRLSGMLEDTLMQTINSTIKAANASGTAVTQEAIGAKLENSINQALSDLQIPPELATGLSREVKDAVQKMRTSGEDQVDFSEIINQVPQLGRVLESSRRAQELANKALEYWQQNLNEYANAMNNLVDTQVDINSRLRRSTDILISGQLALGKALGQSISLQTSVALADRRTGAQTGGVTDPAAIAFNISNLERLRSTQEAQAQGAAQKGFGGKDEFANMQNNLANTNLALRENYAALKDMAENTDKANAAMERISELRAKTQAGVGIAERLVTSSPQELASLNRSMALLNNNMRGGMNIGSTAEDRKGVLDVFNMIAPFLGERQDALKANVLESMLRESGLGVNNMMQGVLDSLRNPAGDPQMAEAIRIYNQGLSQQVEANRQLANLAAIMNQNNADIAAQKLATAIQGVQLKFETQTLSDINTGIQQLVSIAQQKAPGNVAGAVGIAKGGIVYAAEGQHIDFKTKGTDTVPAMLTPGEFVVNRSATQKHLPLLHSINNGYQNGGRVSYYQDGGLVFGGRWGLGKNMNAQSTINAGPETESKEKLSGLNWNELFSLSPIGVSSKPLPKNNTVGSVAGFIGFAGSDTSIPLLDSVPIKNGDRGNLGGSLSLFPGTYAYDKLTLKARSKGDFDQGGSLDITPRDITAAPSLNILDIPNLDFIQKILSTSVNTSFSSRIKKPLLESITEIYNSIPNIKDNGNSFIIGNRTILKTATQNPKAITPTYRVSENGRDLEVVVDNLGQKQYFGNDILLDDMKILQDAQKGVHKNIPGVGKAVGVGIESGVRGRAINAAIGDNAVLRGAGFAWTGLGGQNLWSDLYEKLYSPVKLDIFSSMTGMNSAAKIQQLIDFKARLKEAFETVNKASFVESSASTGRKVLINKMRNLIRGSSFQEIFNPDEIAGGVPTTLFNLPEDVWSQFQFPNSPPGTYATTKNTWAPIGMLDTNGFFTNMKSFPWIRQGFKDEQIIMNRKKEFIKQFGDLVKVTEKNFQGPNISFPYKQISGPLWNQTLGTFNDMPSSFNIIDNFAGDLNPFKGLQLDTNTQAILANAPGGLGGIDAFVRQILDSNNKTGKFRLNIASKLSRNDPFLNKADYTDNTKNNAFINALTKTMEFEPVEYKKILDKVKEDQRIQQREQIAGQAVGLGQQASNFDAAKRVALGRLIYKTALKNKIPIRSRIPDDISNFGPIIESLQQSAQNSPSDYVRTLAAGTKTLFENLQKPDNDGSFFLQNGININNAFNPNNALRKNIKLPDGTFLRDAIYDYRDVAISPESILQLIQRTGLQTRLATGLGSGVARNVGGGLTAEVADRDKAGLSLRGINTVKVDPLTGKTEEVPFVKAAEDALKWGDLFDLAFNPYTQFPDAQGRQGLFAKFREKFNTATVPGTRRPAFDKRLLSWMNTGLDLLSRWYGSQDFFINSGDTPDISGQKKTRLDAQGAGSVNAFRTPAQKANLFYTNNKFGELPTYEWLQAKLDQKINPANAQLKQVVPQAKARGGMIYASNGTLVNFQPRGTDTVPAMLTPGEFVVNREATRKNLPLLKNINMATGGVVQYHRAGGVTYDSSTGTYSRSESVSDRILNSVESGNKLTGLTYGIAGRNLNISKDTNTLSNNINNNTSQIRSSVKQATGFATGGMIYANNGALINFQPKGTDTIPAMLTPGEFVVRREATQKHLSLLHAINNNSFSGDSAITLNKGGYIQPAYLRTGGFGLPSLASLPDMVTKLAGGIQNAVEKAITDAFNNIELPSSNNNTGVSTNKEIANQIGAFANNLTNLANKLESISIPPEITIQGKQDINVNANGLQVLSALNPSLGKIALNMIKTAIDNLATKNPGTLDFSIDYPQGQ